jgi:LPS sulfotransferase NodH
MIVWIFREQRSGSTALTSLIANRLNRIDKFVRYPEDIDMVKNIPNPEDYVFSTHFYNFIEMMDSYDKPVMLIRCARKDKIERCISYLIAKYKAKQIINDINPWNIIRKEGMSDHETFMSNIEPTVFSKKEIYNYLQYCTEMNQYWESYAASYQNCTVFYEDLCTDIGVDLPMLGLTSLSITTDDTLTIKMPSYKEQICINYDMVSRWISEYYSENRI